MSLQLLVAITPSWNAIEGKLYRYQRESSQELWKTAGATISINFGKKGMACGRGIYALPLKGEQKREGDEKSPAGVFTLGPIFGDKTYFFPNMPFLPVTEDLEFVDDSNSSFYNRFVTSSCAVEKDWKSSEIISKIDLYHLGLVIHHNMNPITPGLGSAIFMHTWRKEGYGSGGCTVMAKEHLEEIISWLDSKKEPLLIQLPREEYLSLQDQQKWPEI